MKKIMPHLKNIANILGIITVLVILIALPFLAMAASAVGKDNLAFALVAITGIVGPMYIYSL